MAGEVGPARDAGYVGLNLVVCGGGFVGGLGVSRPVAVEAEGGVEGLVGEGEVVGLCTECHHGDRRGGWGAEAGGDVWRGVELGDEGDVDAGWLGWDGARVVVGGAGGDDGDAAGGRLVLA